MKKIFLFVAFVLFAGQSLLACPKAQQRSIVILYENDVHCAIDGYQVLAGLRDAMADTAFVAVVSSGDFVQGGTAGAISRGQYVADIMRQVDYDVITLGNHEFDYPVSHTEQLLKYIGAPVVSANLYDLQKQKYVYAPFLIKKFGKTKIAFVGVTTPGTLYTETAAFYENGQQRYDLREKDFYEVIQHAVDKARHRGADYVVLLAHLGEDPDRTGITSHELVRHTTGIDIVLDGHTHSVIPHDTIVDAAGKPVVVTETGTKFNHIGALLIRNGRITNELIPSRTLSQRSSKVAAVTDSINRLMNAFTQRVVCHNDVFLRVHNEKGQREIRFAETNLGDLVADAYRVISGADMGFANGGGIRTEKQPGYLTYGDVADMLPYDNHLWMVEAKGSTVLELIRKNTSFVPIEDGSFPQVSGVRFTVHTSDRTVSDVEVLNKTTGEYEPLNPEKTYTISTVDYCVTGGGFYDILKDCNVIQRGEVLYRDVLVEFIERHLHGRITSDYAAPQGRIKIVP